MNIKSLVGFSRGKNVRRRIITLSWILGIVLVVSACQPMVKSVRLSGPCPLPALSPDPYADVSLPLTEMRTPLDVFGPTKFKREDVKDFRELMARLQKPTAKEKQERTLTIAVRKLLEDENPDLPERIDLYDHNYPEPDSENDLLNEQTENDLLNALNALITADSNLIYDQIPNIPQLKGPGVIRQSAETAFYLCLHERMGGGSLLRKQRERQRFNRVLLEDLYRRAFRKSTSLSFLLRFLDDDIPADCKSDSLSRSAFACCPLEELSRRVVLRPGDWVQLNYATGFQRKAATPKNRGLMLPPFSTVGFAVRYLPNDISQLMIGDEIQFLDLFIRSQMGTHTEEAQADKMPALEIDAVSAAGALGGALDLSAPAVWNALIDPATGQLSLNLPVPGEQSSLSARILRVLLNDVSMPPAEMWIKSTRNTKKIKAPYDNAFEDLHVPFLGACPQKTPHSSFLGSKNHSQLQTRLEPDWIQWDKQTESGAFAGHVMQVQVTRGRVDWSWNLAGRRPWTLAEWEASDVLGHIEGKFQALYFKRETLPEPCTSLDDTDPLSRFCKELPKRKLRIEIAWPDSPYMANVGLRQFKPTGPAYLVPLLPKTKAEPFVLSYKDLRFLSRPAWVADTDPIEKYLADVPLAFKTRGVLWPVEFTNKEKIRRDRQINVSWHDLNGFKIWREITDEDKAVPKCLPVNKESLFFRLFLRHQASRNQALEAISAYATSLDAWYRYRLASPEARNQIKRLIISDGRSIDVTDDPEKATHRVLPVDDHAGAAVVLWRGKYQKAGNQKWIFHSVPPDDTYPMLIHRHDLNNLTAFHVKEVHGLTSKPLQGFAGDDR